MNHPMTDYRDQSSFGDAVTLSQALPSMEAGTILKQACTHDRIETLLIITATPLLPVSL